MLRYPSTKHTPNSNHLVNSRYELFKTRYKFVLSCFNSSYLEFTRCYYSEYVLCFILSNCLLVKVFKVSKSVAFACIEIGLLVSRLHVGLFFSIGHAQHR